MATLTITTPADQDARIAAAFGSYLGFAQPASGPQIKQAVVNWMVNVVRNAEYQAAIATVAQPSSVTPS